MKTSMIEVNHAEDKGEKYLTIKGEFTVEWLRHITGYELPHRKTEDKPEYPCCLNGGPCEQYIVSRTAIYIWLVTIHSNGICVREVAKDFIYKVADHINSHIPEGVFQ